MYAWSVAEEDVIDDNNIARELDGTAKHSELFYWRKHYDLHGWMKDLYYSRGGDVSEQFNCVKLRLYPEDLDALELDIIENNLPATQGFFFGVDYSDEGSREYDLSFIKKARMEILDGRAVYYDSWW